ncbi:MAG: Flp family type IVb pilin [Deltaproteobacteria bacterium]|nr:Flp family type IVb pilin [Deltaproteobacteria bacterium]
MRFRLPIRRLLRDESGASAVEYALLIGGIAALLIATVAYLGQTVNNLYASFVLQ